MSPLYIFEFNISCSTPLTILPPETCTLSALGTFSIGIRPTQRGSTVLRGGSQFLKRICGSGEVGEFIWRRGSGSFTGVRRLWGSSGLQERQWYWYKGTSSLGGFKKDFSNLSLQKGDAKFQRFKWKTRVSRLRSISGRRYW